MSKQRANAPQGAEQKREERKNKKQTEQTAHLRSKQHICVITVQESSCEHSGLIFFGEKKKRCVSEKNKMPV